MMSEVERRSDPYIVGRHEPAPAVMSLNSTVSSLAVTMFMNAAIEFPGQSRHMLYNAVAGSLRQVQGQRDPNCFICSSHGVLAKGDATELMARQD
jgi:hypothetical protein